MKTNILSFLLGICIMLLISATAQTTGLFTVKPAKPVHSVVIAQQLPYSAVKSIQFYTKQGYVVDKLLYVYNDGGYTVAVLNKY